MQTTKKTCEDLHSKVCFKCMTVKPLAEFYKHGRMADGRLNKCKSCTKFDVSNHRHGKGRERVLSYDRARSSHPKRVEYSKMVQERWRGDHPERRKAQIKLGNAVRDGKISPQPCFECGDKAEAHHPDYSMPLDVVWLCPSHHKQLHSLHKKLVEKSCQSP